MWVFRSWHLNFLFAFCFCLPVLATSPQMCQSEMKKLFSISSQENFLSKIYDEVLSIIRDNQIYITNNKVRDILLQWDKNARKPRIMRLFEVANILGVKVSDLFAHAGNLKAHIIPSQIGANGPDLTLEKERQIFERTHLFLSGLINHYLLKKNLSLEGLAQQTGIGLEVFHSILKGMDLPFLSSFLSMLVKLDVDMVIFFKNVEEGVQKPKHFGPVKTFDDQSYPWNRGEIEEDTKKLFIQINNDLWDIVKDINSNSNSGILRLKNALHAYKNRFKDMKKSRLVLSKVLQTAHILGINPSEVLKYAGNLKSHVKWSGLRSRDLLTQEEMNILTGKILQHLIDAIYSSEKTLEELSKTTEMPLSYFQSLEWQRRVPRISIMERILRALGSNCIQFFEQLESQGKIKISNVRLETPTFLWGEWARKDEAWSRFIGGRVSEIQEIIRPMTTARKLRTLIANKVHSNTGKDFTQRKLDFLTLYKFSRVAGITLSELVGKRPIKNLIDPKRVRIERIPDEEIENAKRLLTHLLLSEAVVQKNISGLTLTGLATKAHVKPKVARMFLLGRNTPSSPMLRRLVEGGLEVPLGHFLLNFETKLKAFKHIPFGNPRILVSELKGPYLSEKAENGLNHVQLRLNLAREFLKSLKLSVSSPIGRRHGFNQVHTVIRFSRFFGISVKDFLGHKNFAELVDTDKLNFEGLSKEQIKQIIAPIKEKIEERRTALGLPISDFTIMMGESELFQGAFSLTWAKYFHAAEILAREGEDDLFLLDDLDALAGGG